MENEGDSSPPSNKEELEKGEEKDESSGDAAGDSNSDDDDDDSASESDWSPVSEAVTWVQEAVEGGAGPSEVLRRLLPEFCLPDQMSETELWAVVVHVLTEPSPRTKLAEYNTLDDAVELLGRCSNVLVLTGAGVSVSCGIPDFRSRDGLYARIHSKFPNLPSPQAMFDIDFFRQDPRPFFEFAKEVYPGKFEPSRSHKFIKKLENEGKLLRNYTQNIDTLERAAGIQNLIECHGSFATASCTRCSRQVAAEQVEEAVLAKEIPRCDCDGVIKPDIVFFGEGLPNSFHDKLKTDKETLDLLLVVGSSLKVAPVARIPNCLPPQVPQILVNRQPLHHKTFDIELLGNSDAIIDELCRRLGGSWTELCEKERGRTEAPLPPASFKEQQCDPEVKRRRTDDPPSSSDKPLPPLLPPRTYFFLPPSRHLFEGAELEVENDSELSNAHQNVNNEVQS